MTTELRSRRVVCRTHHRCDWCGERIDKGESARYRVTVYYGEFAAVHMHDECYRAMNATSPKTWWEHGYEYLPGEQSRGVTLDEE